MKYLVMAYDGLDDQAPTRRAAAKPAHRQLAREMNGKNQLLYAAVILDDDEKAIGSMRVMDLPSEEALEEWKAQEPYLIDGVWERVEICRCSIPDVIA